MLVKVCNQVVTPLPFPLQTTAAKERRVIPLDSQDMRYLRFKAIGNFEVAGQNGNWDAFPYVWFEDERPGYGYKSFVNKRAHTEHNSTLGMAGSIGDLPDAYLNRFTLEGLSIPFEFATIKNLKWDKLAGKKYADFRSQVLSAPNQKDGSIEVLMRIDTKLVKSATVEPKTKHLLERIIRMIDTGQRLSCSMGCFVPGTQILLPDGTYELIENIKNGMMLPTHTGLLQFVSDTMVRSYDGNILKITVTGHQRPLQLTPEHPVLIRKKYSLCVCGCGGRVNKSSGMWLSGHHQNIFNSNPKIKRSKKKDNELREKLRQQSLEQLEWVEARDVEEGDCVAFPISYEEIASPQITLGKAKLIGYFLAEGSFVKYTTKEGEIYKSGVAFSFGGTSKDKIFIQETLRLFQEEFDKKGKVYKSRNYVSSETSEERYGTSSKYGCVEIRVISREIANFFDFYCGEGAKTKRLPEEVLQWQKPLQQQLIAGYFNGDGNQHTLENGISTISSVTVSETLGYQISFMLKRLGIPNILDRRFYSYQVNPTYTIYVRSQWQNILYGIWSYDKAKETDRKSSSFFKVSDNYILSPVVKTEQTFYKGPVYNLEVENTHSYIANGVAVHNCNIARSVCSTCGNEAQFAYQYCSHMKPTRKGGLTIVPANQIRDLLDKDLLRPEWLKHTVASKFDQEEIIKGASNKGVAVRNVEINHECSFFELSVVATPAYADAIALEKLARLQSEDRREYMKRLASVFTNEELLDVYEELKRRELISSVCQVA